MGRWGDGGDGELGSWGAGEMSFSPLPLEPLLPNAPCPMPHAPCPMPNDL
ncbi:MAG: histidine kinase [Nostoc sp. GBBB01]|nr:histidine kinase [Nostoc sp. GBBB01]